MVQALPETVAKISVRPPTRPKYISRIRMPRESRDNCGVMPSVRPTVPTAEARKGVNDYMTTVLHEEPVDPSLMDFDDSEGW